MFKHFHKFNMAIAVAILLFVPTALCGQNAQIGKGVINDLQKKVIWLNKQSFDNLKDIAKWEEIKHRYNDSITIRDSLKKAIEQDESTKANLMKQLKELHSHLAVTFAEIKVTQTDKPHSFCDTTILLLHQGMYGDSILEKKQEALFTLFRIKKCLSNPYDEERVTYARELLKTCVSKEFSFEYEKVDHLLEQYGTITKNLRKALDAANKVRPKPDSTRAQHMTEKYKKEFFAEMVKTLNPILLSPKVYPYLYGILNEAIEVKMEDPSNDIAEQIKKL